MWMICLCACLCECLYSSRLSHGPVADAIRWDEVDYDDPESVVKRMKLPPIRQ
jgi:hypothetical protein